MKKLRKKTKSKSKVVEERLQTQAAAMLKHPKECCICKAVFERNQDTVKTWTVTVREERVRLTCPTCWKIVVEAMENLNED